MQNATFVEQLLCKTVANNFSYKITQVHNTSFYYASLQFNFNASTDNYMILAKWLSSFVKL